MPVLTNAQIGLGVCGGISAYKSADLASKLVQSGCTVTVMMTASAHQFVGPATFEAITHRPVYGSPFVPWHDDFSGHVTIARTLDALIVAPATADTIARLAQGRADDMLATVALSTRAPILLAPAMEEGMWLHPATQANLALLRARGAWVVEPEQGRLASGASGIGRLAAIETILGDLRHLLARNNELAGRRIVVSAGGTQEPLDPVRYLGNRSSGRMGLALAQAAIDLGAEVTLIAGPQIATGPRGTTLVHATTAEEMRVAVTAAVHDADALVMAAAVADFRPRNIEGSKIKKTAGIDQLTLDLEKTTDILASIDQPGLLKIGFAAETDQHRENAIGKLRAKGLAMIVLNDAVSTIGSKEAELTLIHADGRERRLPMQSKEEAAEAVIAEVAALIVGSTR